MKMQKNKPMHRIMWTLPIYFIILYRSYNLKINAESIIYTLIYLSMIVIDVYIYNKNKKR